MTYQKAAQEVIAMQNACNLSGLVFSLPEIMQAICDEAQRLGQGTDWKNRNPLVTIILDKLNDLNGRPDSLQRVRAYKAVEETADGHPQEQTT